MTTCLHVRYVLARIATVENVSLRSLGLGPSGFCFGEMKKIHSVQRDKLGSRTLSTLHE